MTQNSEAAQQLEQWLQELSSMKDKAVKHLDILMKIGNQTHRPQWLNDAINKAQEGIDHLNNAEISTSHLINLAKSEQLYDPRQG